MSATRPFSISCELVIIVQYYVFYSHGNLYILNTNTNFNSLLYLPKFTNTYKGSGSGPGLAGGAAPTFPSSSLIVTRLAHSPVPLRDCDVAILCHNNLRVLLVESDAQGF